MTTNTERVNLSFPNRKAFELEIVLRDDKIRKVFLRELPHSEMYGDEYYIQQKFEETVDAYNDELPELSASTCLHRGIEMKGFVYNPTGQFFGFRFESDSWSGDNREFIICDMEPVTINQSVEGTVRHGEIVPNGL